MLQRGRIEINTYKVSQILNVDIFHAKVELSGDVNYGILLS